MRIVQLLSGGLDSMGQAIILRTQEHTIYPLYVRFRMAGGKQAREQRIVQELSDVCGLETPRIVIHRIDRKDYDMRNRLLCRIAEEYAIELGADSIAIGAPTGSYNFGTANDEDLDVDVLKACVDIDVHTTGLYKCIILKRIPESLRWVMPRTSSCHMWYKQECGQCYICAERHAAFIVAYGYDQTVYIENPRGSRHWKALLEQEVNAYEREGQT